MAKQGIVTAPLSLGDSHARAPIGVTGRPRTAIPPVDIVLLITVDAFRADQPWVGYRGVDTPNLSKLAARSLVYTHAYSLANITTASLNAMLASRYPSELKREGCIFARYDLKGSLAPFLQTHAVRTVAAHGQALFTGRTAPSLGFEQWKLVRGAASRLQAEGAVVGAEIADLASAYLGEDSPPGRKLFAWSHFPDPHDAYVAHKAYPVKSGSLRAKYDSEVAYTDAAIGRVLDAIEQKGLADRTAILLTADHGEAFGEHRMLGHGFTMYDEEIRVPLLLYVPGVDPAMVSIARSTIDIAPTIVDLFGYAPPPNWKGVSLLRDLSGTPEARTVIADLPEMKGRVKKRAVMMGDYKVIFTQRSSMVFDVRRDPREQAPLPPDDQGARAAIERARTELDNLDVVEASPCEGWTPRK